jgi:hypothetical protein
MLFVEEHGDQDFGSSMQETKTPHITCSPPDRFEIPKNLDKKLSFRVESESGIQIEGGHNTKYLDWVIPVMYE